MDKILGYGLCLCGCGNKTRIAPYCDKTRGWIKGEPIRYDISRRLICQN